jgi:ABC-type multidrug transport system ATPase subunit
MTSALPAVLRGAELRYEGGRIGLAGVDLALGAGEIVGLVGANGAGKSSLLGLLAGRITPTAGTVEFAGKPAAAWPGPARRQAVTLVEQDPALDPEMTAAEHLALFASLSGLRGGAVAARIRAVAVAFEVVPWQHVRVARLSGGQRQRLHLAIGALAPASLVLFDEPTNALDPQARSRFWQALAADRTADRSFVVATHLVDDVVSHCDRVWAMSGGRVIADGTPAEVLAAAGVDSLAALLAREPDPASGSEGAGHPRGRRGTGRGRV